MTAYGCTCPWTPEDTWLSGASCGHGGGYEPGSQQEFDPGCPEHGDSSTATVALCPECGVERPVVEMHYERPFDVGDGGREPYALLLALLDCGHLCAPGVAL